MGSRCSGAIQPNAIFERSFLQVQAQRVGLIEGPGGYRRGR